MKPNLRRWHPAVSLGLLFGWVLSFPMFGPLLAQRAGEDATGLSLAYLIGSICAFAWAGFRATPLSPQMRSAAAAFIAAGTAAYFAGLVPKGTSSTSLFFALALAVTPLMVDWTQWLAQSKQPHLPLAQSMIASNLLLVAALLPGLPTETANVALTLIPLVVVYCWPSYHDRPAPTPLVADVTAARRSVLALAAFGVITYVIGGIWFRVYSVPSLSEGAWLNVFDITCYMLTLAGLAWWLSARHDLAPIATLTLSVLGLGLVLAPLWDSLLPRVLLSIGLAGTDYYYWLALWALSRFLPARRVFAWGLGFSLVQITAATLVGIYGTILGYPREMFFGFALVVTMLMLPAVFGSRFNLTPASSKREYLVPANLTEAERKVFALLTTGSGDQQIADALHISRHTVKFHVRNILHKCGVPNRKVLLSMLRDQQSPPRPEATQ